jgi:hypothetical protein
MKIRLAIIFSFLPLILFGQDRIIESPTTISVSNEEIYLELSQNIARINDVILNISTDEKIRVGLIRENKLTLSLPRIIKENKLNDPVYLGAYDATTGLKILVANIKIAEETELFPNLMNSEGGLVVFIFSNQDGHLTIAGTTFILKLGWNIVIEDTGERIDNLNVLYKRGYKWKL